MDTHDQLTVTEVARRSGFAASALRYYEDQGLIDATRSDGGRRRYERSVLRRLAFIRAASNIGLSLGELRAALDRLRDGFDSCIGCGCLSLRHCALANTHDRAAATTSAPGAAYLPAVLR